MRTDFPTVLPVAKHSAAEARKARLTVCRAALAQPDPHTDAALLLAALGLLPVPVKRLGRVSGKGDRGGAS